ncbi:IclR family transcriptional regulator [Mycobacterium terramassiliense]|uniref:Glycerol operon regulatory protein n=1 Tax=Mycobacterium terramassiliense TaxID=1841859 RepID=A0A2U3NGR2_9MYCO|nr:IclR family transcriptional regulator [Mycobacterium terramassiliense]SPM30624.1 DNA-binding transcriptional regulator, IclR family [Mycobacterium terramassiliense]
MARKRSVTGRAQPDNRSSYIVTALARGLAVLNAFGPERYELSLRDLADAAGVTPASAFRIGFTLIEAGYVIRNPVTKGYRLGPRALSIGIETLSAMTLTEIAAPYLVALRDRTNETVKLAIPTGLQVVVVARVPSLSYPTMTNYIGAQMPATISSLGRAVLAWETTELMTSVLSKTKSLRLTPKTLPKPQLREELETTRKRGYAVNDQGTTMEHRSVGAPLLASSGHPIGAVNVSVSAQRISMAELKRRIAPEVVQTAADISRVLPPEVQGAGRLGVSV